jgi:transcriptional regulator of acetoin/glycerol metabolism
LSAGITGQPFGFFPKALPVSCERREKLQKANKKRKRRKTRWVVAGRNGAAARLGIKRSTLYFRMQKLGISRATMDAVPVQQN